MEKLAVRPFYRLAVASLLWAAWASPVTPQTPPDAAPKEATTKTPAFAPQPSDGTLARGRAFVDRAYLTDNKLTIMGNLPTPCHQLRVAVPDAPGPTGALAVEVYSVAERRQICAQVLKPFRVDVDLTAPQAAGSVMINRATVQRLADR